MHCDCKRTRCLLPEFTTDLQLLMERMLTCFCKEQAIPYKQGMNEVLRPQQLWSSGGVVFHSCFL